MIVVNNIAICQRAIVQYRACRNNFPDHIIVYRDGVSEGEYVQVENNEIAAIQGAVDRSQYFPNMT